MHTSQLSSLFLGVMAVAVVTGRPEPPSLHSSYSTMMNDLAPPSLNAPSASYGPSEMTSFLAPDPGTSDDVHRYGRVSGRFRDSQYQFGTYISAKMDDDSSEPAHYEYSYSVNDRPSVSEFGHEERREGPAAMGRYHVLLPDGRRQIVEYEADQDGFRPQISYEEQSGPY